MYGKQIMIVIVTDMINVVWETEILVKSNKKMIGYL